MLPDILGYKLSKALPLLREAGFMATVVITKPTRNFPDGCKRVVKTEVKDTKHVVLTVVCEEKGDIHNGL